MTTSLRFATATAAQTRELGQALAAVVRPGDVVSLSGDLGAGKTCLVQGLARGLDVSLPVTSPTFMLQKTYPGRELLVHLDVYRLDRLRDVVDLGDEAMAPDVVTVIEWGDTIQSLLPPDRLELELRHRDGIGQGLDDDVTPAALGDEPAPVDADGELVDLPRTVVATLHGRWQERHDDLAASARPLLDPESP
ncbi:MAG TPA: tRNA (adenosine(37)-N6)-threonylcarbamoyltransferase complex ATPase subunit type 1 TsaE [Nitriliruptoraceae bacterium]|nr:tRNA (adenosine(37)-N6)-threonylcarbamoyltransferase complex ATPase subunit type 1 TsaE [Nitriliruptoraceae bacterium]